MEQQTPLEIKQLRRRFIKDYDLPLQIVHSPYFEDRLELAENEYGAKTKYDNLLSLINERFDGKASKFLDEYNNVKTNIITTVSNSKAFKDFISNDKFLIKDIKLTCPNRNLYTNEQDGCLFVSFDMKKANFQTLRYANPSIVYDANTYEEFIGKFTDLDYIKESKYTRQRIFGELNPKRTMMLEQYITNEFAKEYQAKLGIYGFTPFSLKNDEIIFKFEGGEEEFKHFNISSTIEYDGIIYKVSKFKLHARQFKLATSSSILTIYEKEEYSDVHKRILKGVPATYYPQVDKLLRGEEITPLDLKFYYEHEICSFDYPLTLLK